MKRREEKRREEKRREQIENGYGTGTEWIQNRSRTGTGMRVEQRQNFLFHAFPVGFLLIDTVEE